MRLILLGPPASGKGTQAQLLSQRLGLAHISTGDLLRDAVRHGTPAGRKAAPFLATGQLVADDLVNDIVKESFTGDQRPESFVMDGYPRTVPQAAAFDALLRQQFLSLDAVVHLSLADEEIVQRISGRLTCPNTECGATYHTIYKKPKIAGVCDLCSSPLFQRDDDKEATVRHRLQLYHQNNDALVKYYQAQGLLKAVPAVGDIESIYHQLVKILQDAQS